MEIYKNISPYIFFLICEIKKKVFKFDAIV